MSRDLVSLVRNLQRRGSRRRQPRAVAEGVRLVEEVLDAGVTVVGAVRSPALERTPRGVELARRLAERGVHTVEVSDRDFEGLADTDRPQGVLAVVEPPAWSFEDLEPAPAHPVLVTDGVQDPGNVGAIVRTTYALGGAGVVVLGGSARANHPKVLRSAAGASFRFPVFGADDETFGGWLDAQRVSLWTTSPTGTPVSELTPPPRLAIVVGSEGAGVRDAVQRRAAAVAGVPHVRPLESLNVAVAAALLLYEVVGER